MHPFWLCHTTPFGTGFPGMFLQPGFELGGPGNHGFDHPRLWCFFFGGGWQFLPLDIQIPPQEKVWMAYFRGPTTFSAGVWMSRVHTLFLHLLLDMASFAQDWDEVDWCSRSMRVTKTDDHRRDPHKSGKSYDAEKTLRMTGWFLKNLEGVLTSFYCHCIISVIFFCCKAFSMGTMGLPNKLKPSFQFTTLWDVRNSRTSKDDP